MEKRIDAKPIVGLWNADNESVNFGSKGSGFWNRKWDDGDVSSEAFQFVLVDVAAHRGYYGLGIKVHSTGKSRNPDLWIDEGDFEFQGEKYKRRLRLTSKLFFTGESRVFYGN